MQGFGGQTARAGHGGNDQRVTNGAFATVSSRVTSAWRDQGETVLAVRRTELYADLDALRASAVSEPRPVAPTVRDNLRLLLSELAPSPA